MNGEKDEVVSVAAIQKNFKFLGFALGEGQEWLFHSCPCKVPKESKAEAKRTDFPQSGQKCLRGNAERKGLDSRMAWLLRNLKHENHSGGLGWLRRRFRMYI